MMKVLTNMCKKCGRMFQSQFRLKECPSCKSKDIISWTYGSSPKYGMPLAVKAVIVAVTALVTFVCVMLAIF